MERRAATEDPIPDCAWHDRLVEHFGANGQGGEWGRTMKTVAEHDAAIDKFNALAWRLSGMVTIAAAIAGVIVAVVSKHL